MVQLVIAVLLVTQVVVMQVPREITDLSDR